MATRAVLPVQPENFRAILVEKLRFSVKPENIRWLIRFYPVPGEPENAVPIPNRSDFYKSHQKCVTI